ALLDLAPDPVVRVEEAPPGLVLEGGEARRRHVGILTVTGPPRGGISACADSYIGRRRCTAAHDPSDRTRETGNRDDHRDPPGAGALAVRDRLHDVRGDHRGPGDRTHPLPPPP